jgi:lysophospholipase L1-like esterase
MLRSYSGVGLGRWSTRAAVFSVLASVLLVGGVPSLALAADAATFDLPATDDGIPGAGPIRRYDWFKGLWKDRRSKWAGQKEKDTGAVVFLGDSITQGWGDDLGGTFPGLKVANRGISGDTTRGMLLRLKEDVLSLQPKGIVLLMGTNDLEEKAEPETIAGNVKLIVADIKKHDPKLPVVLCLVMPSSATKSRPADKIKKINELYAAAFKGDGQVTIVDTWTLFADDKGDAKAAEFPDLLHPNAAGYKMWGAAIRPVLATLGFVETEPDAFTPEEGFVSLFNGKDLTGWGFREYKTLAKQETFDGKSASSDGRYVALNGRIVVTTPPEGRRVQQMWSTREFPKNFTLKLEFRATPNADSGVFVRHPQLQCRDYPLAGPYKTLKQYRPQDWNELVVVVKDNVAHCTCNGEVLEAALKLPETGPVGLEGDRGQMEYRRIRVREE